MAPSSIEIGIMSKLNFDGIRCVVISRDQKEECQHQFMMTVETVIWWLKIQEKEQGKSF